MDISIYPHLPTYLCLLPLCSEDPYLLMNELAERRIKHELTRTKI